MPNCTVRIAPVKKQKAGVGSAGSPGSLRWLRGGLGLAPGISFGVCIRCRSAATPSLMYGCGKRPLTRQHVRGRHLRRPPDVISAKQEALSRRRIWLCSSAPIRQAGRCASTRAFCPRSWRVRLGETADIARSGNHGGTTLNKMLIRLPWPGIFTALRIPSTRGCVPPQIKPLGRDWE